jgi:hypothetical protein
LTRCSHGCMSDDLQIFPFVSCKREEKLIEWECKSVATKEEQSQKPKHDLR